MENVKHCAVVVRRAEDVWEATRTALGLAAHNFWATLYVIDVAVEMTAALRENLDWLEEMECGYVSSSRENDPHSFKHMSLEDIAEELKKVDLIIPFGDRNRTSRSRSV